MTNMLHSQILNIEKTLGGKTGVYAFHSKTGNVYSLNGDELFPMASIDKIPLAAYCLSLVEKHTINLDQIMEIEPTDIRPGTGLLNKRFITPGIMLSVENLIKLLLEVSDNTANDKLLHLVGGPIAVTQWLKSIEIEGIEVSRSCLRGLAEQVGIHTIPDDEKCTLEEFQSLEDSIDSETKRKYEENYLNDLQDTATPKAIVHLLQNIKNNTILNRKSSTLLFQCMQRCQTGQARIPNLLPPEVKVAHKTGTMFGVTNDAGIIEFPENSENLFLAIFVKSTTASLIEKEQGIAQIAHIFYQYFRNI